MENGLFKDELPTVTIKWWVSIANCWTTRGYHYTTIIVIIIIVTIISIMIIISPTILVSVFLPRNHHATIMIVFQNDDKKSVILHQNTISYACHFRILIILPPSHSTHPVTTGPASLRLWGSLDPGSSSFSIFWTAPGHWWSTVVNGPPLKRWRTHWLSLGWSGNYPAW